MNGIGGKHFWFRRVLGKRGLSRFEFARQFVNAVIESVGGVLVERIYRARKRFRIISVFPFLNEFYDSVSRPVGNERTRLYIVHYVSFLRYRIGDVERVLVSAERVSYSRVGKRRGIYVEVIQNEKADYLVLRSKVRYVVEVAVCEHQIIRRYFVARFLDYPSELRCRRHSARGFVPAGSGSLRLGFCFSRVFSRIGVHAYYGNAVKSGYVRAKAYSARVGEILEVLSVCFVRVRLCGRCGTGLKPGVFHAARRIRPLGRLIEPIFAFVEEIEFRSLRNLAVAAVNAFFSSRTVAVTEIGINLEYVFTRGRPYRTRGVILHKFEFCFVGSASGEFFFRRHITYRTVVIHIVVAGNDENLKLFITGNRSHFCGKFGQIMRESQVRRVFAVTRKVARKKNDMRRVSARDGKFVYLAERGYRSRFALRKQFRRPGIADKIRGIDIAVFLRKYMRIGQMRNPRFFGPVLCGVCAHSRAPDTDEQRRQHENRRKSNRSRVYRTNFLHRICFLAF